jgi:hypothetical protein
LKSYYSIIREVIGEAMSGTISKLDGGGEETLGKSMENVERRYGNS